MKTAASPPMTDITTPMFSMNNANNKLKVNQMSVCMIRLGLALLDASADERFHDVTHILSTANLQIQIRY